MSGIRTAGDLVLRMQLSKSMKIDDAKKYVAEKLGVKPIELSDSDVMFEVRAENGLGRSFDLNKSPKGVEAKFNIARILGIKINSVERFKERAGL
jgi:dimethylamine--corrinoid protein Co-methyltransferase